MYDKKVFGEMEDARHAYGPLKAEGNTGFLFIVVMAFT